MDMNTTQISPSETMDFSMVDALPVPEPRCYKVEDIMTILDVDRIAVYSLIKKEEFRAVKIGNKYRISRKSFDAWLDGNI